MVIRVCLSTYNHHVIFHVIIHVILVFIRIAYTRVRVRILKIYNGPCGPHALLVFLIAGRWLGATTPRVGFFIVSATEVSRRPLLFRFLFRAYGLRVRSLRTGSSLPTD